MDSFDSAAARLPWPGCISPVVSSPPLGVISHLVGGVLCQLNHSSGEAPRQKQGFVENKNIVGLGVFRN